MLKYLYKDVHFKKLNFSPCKWGARNFNICIFYYFGGFSLFLPLRKFQAFQPLDSNSKAKYKEAFPNKT